MLNLPITSNDCGIGICSTDKFKAYFEQYCDYAGNLYNDECDPIIDYFEDTYIGRFRQNAPRRAPLFAQALWNMFHRTFNEVARINNSIEGWWRSFQATVGPSHPSVWKFMEKLIQGLGRHLANLLQVLGGHLAPRVGRQSFNPNQRLI